MLESAFSGAKLAARVRRHHRLLLLVACLAGVTGYAALAVPLLNAPIARQIAVTGHPFVVSDLFPRWLGARALLHGQDPYGAAFVRELHQQYYGAPKSPEEESRLFGTICEFFYPPSVVLPLLPLLWLPFEAARWLWGGVLVVCLVASPLIWLRTVDPKAPRRRYLLMGAFAIAFFPSLVTLWLQQIAALVLLYLVGAYGLAARRHYAWAGVVLALAFIKPQMAIIPAAGLLLWSLGRRDRWGLPLVFGATMAGQLAFAQLLLPGWLGEFISATVRYQAYNKIGYWLPGMLAGSTARAALLVVAPLAAVLIYLWWKHRRLPLGTAQNASTAALTFAAAATLMPDMSFYNKILLLVPLVSLAQAGLGKRPIRTFTARATWCAVATPFLALAAGGWERIARHALGTPELVNADSWLAVVQASLVLLPFIVTLAVAALCLQREAVSLTQTSTSKGWPVRAASSPQNAPAA